MNGWQEYIEDGNKYLKTAVKGHESRKQVFTPEIIYNIVSMSIEKQIMGLLMYHNRLPENHTLRDLTDAVKELCPVTEGEFHCFPQDLGEKLLAMDRFQEICCLDAYHRQTPCEEDVLEFIDTGQKVQTFVAECL
ncbi:MAG: hypothetical protein AB7S75_04795 [Desulfococcaceae bacterium]